MRRGKEGRKEDAGVNILLCPMDVHGVTCLSEPQNLPVLS